MFLCLSGGAASLVAHGTLASGVRSSDLTGVQPRVQLQHSQIHQPPGCELVNRCLKKLVSYHCGAYAGYAFINLLLIMRQC